LFFDDRLATVLRQRATGEAGLRTQYRQLLDLLGKERLHRGGRRDQSLVAAAWLRMDALAEAIPAAERARMIREPGWRFRSADLAAHLADHEPEVAAAAITRAELSPEDWSALIPRLPVRARGFLRRRRDLPVDAEALLDRLGIHDRGLPRPEQAEGDARMAHHDAAPSPEPAPTPQAPPVARRSVTPARQPLHNRDRDETGRSEISALVERIAQFRRERGENRIDAELSPRLPLEELPEKADQRIASFGFVADAGGRIEWASSEAGAMVVGLRLLGGRLSAAQPSPSRGREDTAVARAFARRQPISGTPFTLDGAEPIAGDWILDAQPSFSPEGHFTGYAGRFRRSLAAAGSAQRPEAREADRIRQLLHELRTPVTAVQGYAEVIQQQLFGPAPNEYRALAAAIAADAARILAGFDELDRLALLETSALGIEPGEADLAQLLRRTLEQLAPVLEPRNAGIALALAPDASLLVASDHEDAEAMLWRLVASLAAACAADERLEAQLDPLIGNGTAMARLSCTLPAALAQEEDLFAATARVTDSIINPGLFGAGFTLRLARAEARAAGGDLVRDGAVILLTLPLLTVHRGLTGDGAKDNAAGAA